MDEASMLITFSNNECSDQPAQMRRQAKTFTARIHDSLDVEE